MLLANRRVAKYLGSAGKQQRTTTSVYRVHDEPSDEKIADLKIFLDQFGYKIQRAEGKPISFSLNRVLEEATKKEELHIIGPMVIRSMSKAIYDIDNVGHYGLAFDYYTHFTSPIRRYADLLVHRLLEAKLAGRDYKESKELEGQCKHISITEKSATEAERASTKYMQVKYMSDRLGLTFEGTITGVTDWGLFVEIDETKCEGLVHISTLPGKFHVDAKTKRMESFSSDISYHMGMKVDVVVKNVDIFKKQIDLEMSDEER
jgi:VacB/RNase II family 3'-5' exoribonuclease